MAIFLIDLPPNDMERRLGDALGVYVDAMRYPRGTENQRAAMWLEHIRRRGWQGWRVVEVDAGRRRGRAGPVGGRTEQRAVARRGLRLPRGTRAVVAAAGRPGLATRRPAAPGDRRPDEQLLRVDRAAHSSARAGPRPRRGAGPTAARRPAAKRTSCCPRRRPTARPNRAWRLYRRLGFTDVIRRYHFAGDPRAFAILGRTAAAVTAGPRARPGNGDAPKRHAGSGTMTWCAPALAPPRARGFTARRRRVVAIAMLLLLVPAGDRVPAGQGVAHHLARRPGVRRDRRGGQTEDAQGHRPATRQQQPAVQPEGGGVELRQRRLRGIAGGVLRSDFRRVAAAGQHELRRAGRESVAAPKRQPGDPGRPGGSDLADRFRSRRRADRRLPRRGDLHQR